MEGFDELWRGGPRFKQREEGFKLSTDSVLLSDFAVIKKRNRCLDFGSGAGVLCVLLAAKYGDAEITGIEIQPEFAQLCRENLRANNMENRVNIITADLRDFRTLIPAGGFDYAMANPPYFPQNSGFSAPAAHRAVSREEKFCTLEDICKAAKWALRWGGGFSVVYRPERMSELFCTMTAAGLEPKRLRFVQHRASDAPCLILVEGRRGGAPGLAVEPPLVLTDIDGKDSHEAQRIYRRGIYAPGRGDTDL